MKNRFRVLQTGDLHIGAGRAVWGNEDARGRGEFLFNKLISVAVERKVDAVLITGDVFDAPSLTVPELELVTEKMVRLAAVCKVFVISGNHDVTKNKECNLSYLQALADTKEIPNLFVAPMNQPREWDVADGLTVVGASSPLSEDQSWVDAYAAACDDSKQRIFMGHATIRGCVRNDFGWRPQEETAARSLSLAEASQNTSIIWWAYGDIHTAQPLPTLATGANGWYAGSPIQVDFGNDPGKGALVVTFDKTDGEWSYKGRKFVSFDEDPDALPHLVTVHSLEELEKVPKNALLKLGRGMVLSESERERVVRTFKVVVDYTRPKVEGQEVLLDETGRLAIFDPLVASHEEVYHEVIPEASIKDLSEFSQTEMKDVVVAAVDRFRSRIFLT